MPALQTFDSLTEAIVEKVHDLGSDALKVTLCNAANPPAAGNSQLSDLTAVSLANLSSDTLTTSSSSQTSGTYKLVVADKTLTASGGSVGPFQYIVIYNDTATNDELIGYFDNGSEITLADGQSLDLNLSESNGVLQIA